MGSQKPPLNDAHDTTTTTLRRIDRGFRSSAGKVYTANGLRARRLRLSAPTAIQFYDLQDRLGYDRSSEAIDWLIKNAKAAIDALSGSSSEAEADPKMQSPSHLLGLEFPARSFNFPSLATPVPSSSSTQFQSFPLENLTQKANFSVLSPLIFNATPAKFPDQEPLSPTSSNVGTAFPMWE